MIVKNINYSIDKLENEAASRQPILNILDTISKSEVVKKSVLEFGCGNGRNLEVFREDGHDVFGVDGLSDAVNACRKKGIDAHLINLDTEFSLNGKWDLILILDVLEHLEDPLKLLQVSKKFLNEGGRIIINVPNHFTLQGRFRIMLGSGIDSEKFFPDSEVWNYPHLRFFNYESIVDMTKICGLQIHADHSSKLARRPKIKFIPIFMINWIWRKLPINLSSGGFFLELR